MTNNGKSKKINIYFVPSKMYETAHPHPLYNQMSNGKCRLLMFKHAYRSKWKYD